MIINETAKKLFQIKNIEEASLQPESRLWWSMGIDEGKNPPFEIVVNQTLDPVSRVLNIQLRITLL